MDVMLNQSLESDTDAVYVPTSTTVKSARLRNHILILSLRSENQNKPPFSFHVNTSLLMWIWTKASNHKTLVNPIMWINLKLPRNLRESQEKRRSFTKLDSSKKVLEISTALHPTNSSPKLGLSEMQEKLNGQLMPSSFKPMEMISRLFLKLYKDLLSQVWRLPSRLIFKPLNSPASTVLSLDLSMVTIIDLVRKYGATSWLPSKNQSKRSDLHPSHPSI